MEYLLTPNEAAERLGISSRLLKMHREQLRGLPYVRVGRCIRYRMADLSLADNFLDLGRRRQKGDVRRRLRNIRRLNRRKTGGKHA
jgi:hypothetical protein